MALTVRVLTIYVVYLLAALAPGPAVFYVMHVALSSRSRGLRAAWGVATGTTLWVAVAAFGLSVAVKNNPAWTHAVRLAGAFVFFWMSWKLGAGALRRAEDESVADPPPRNLWYAYSYGVATNTTNPATALFFAGLLGLYGVDKMPLPARAAAYCGIPILSLTWYSFVALILSHQRLSRGYQRLRRPLDAVLAVLFFILGIQLLIL